MSPQGASSAAQKQSLSAAALSVSMPFSLSSLGMLPGEMPLSCNKCHDCTEYHSIAGIDSRYQDSEWPRCMQGAFARETRNA
ncbi:hypothetical protein M440DRAFT_1396066 [Trichoderma longibrachiatum ATCC 18648]|uniref:Uncharacterized protein n=1 Tax=Trichoderma longibrachiatum ATCC 18648 TaxID=983965 RepID=A0A2T4CH93_TRILO|nr:hypothetical protein M440DRAFT_1396066 [Trichoderma longibrachiatum ATCC 18648]